jgi:hypothetical protein
VCSLAISPLALRTACIPMHVRIRSASLQPNLNLEASERRLGWPSGLLMSQGNHPACEGVETYSARRQIYTLFQHTIVAPVSCILLVFCLVVSCGYPDTRSLTSSFFLSKLPPSLIHFPVNYRSSQLTACLCPCEGPLRTPTFLFLPSRIRFIRSAA